MRRTRGRIRRSTRQAQTSMPPVEPVRIVRRGWAGAQAPLLIAIGLFLLVALALLVLAQIGLQVAATLVIALALVWLAFSVAHEG
jgi:hypothetical protein